MKKKLVAVVFMAVMLLAVAAPAAFAAGPSTTNMGMCAREAATSGSVYPGIARFYLYIWCGIGHLE